MGGQTHPAQSHFVRLSGDPGVRRTFFFLPRYRLVENLRTPTTRGGCFCTSENFSDFLKAGSALPKQAFFLCRDCPGGGGFLRLRPQAFLGVRSAGRVRPSDHPRAQNARALHGTGARGPRLRAEKAFGSQRRAKLPCKPSCKHLCFTIRPPAPAGVSRLCGAAMPNTGAPGRCGTLQHTRCAELPGSLPGTIRASAKARVTP